MLIEIPVVPAMQDYIDGIRKLDEQIEKGGLNEAQYRKAVEKRGEYYKSLGAVTMGVFESWEKE